MKREKNRCPAVAVPRGFHTEDTRLADDDKVLQLRTVLDPLAPLQNDGLA
jgi:hypothetical protein